VIMLEKSTPSQRGEMSRLAIELKSGVFVADINARVRDKLWEKIAYGWNLNAIMVYSKNTEQSYGIRVNGDPERSVIDFDGISLLSKPVKKPKTVKTDD
jgi:CRISPR-associated protein Cas2